MNITNNAQRLLLDLLAHGGFLRSDDVKLSTTKQAIQELVSHDLLTTVFGGNYVLTKHGSQAGEQIKQSAF